MTYLIHPNTEVTRPNAASIRLIAMRSEIRNSLGKSASLLDITSSNRFDETTFRPVINSLASGERRDTNDRQCPICGFQGDSPVDERDLPHREPNTRLWWSDSKQSRHSKSVTLRNAPSNDQRCFGMEILEERNLLADMTVTQVIQSFLPMPPTSASTIASFSDTAVPDPRTIIVATDPGEGTYAINANTILPTTSYVQGPIGIIAPGPSFNPASAGVSFTSTFVAGSPIISEWTRTASSDDSISIAGGSFSASASVPIRFYVLTDGGGGTAKITMITKQSATESSAIVTLPRSDIPTNAMYMLWGADNDGIGRPVFINQTETWWVGPDAAQAGQLVAVYGRNLSQAGDEWIKGTSLGTAPTWVWIVPDAGGPMQQITVTSTNPYRVEFQLPPSLVSGTYTVWIHNGRGGDYGWGAPLKFIVRNPVLNGTQWSGPTYDVANNAALSQMTSNDFAADDGALLQSALTLAGRSTTGNATVVLPAGTFLIANPLNIPSNVRLKGQGMESSILLAVPSPSFQSLAIIYSSSGNLASNNVSIEDLALNSGYNILGVTDALYTGGVKDLARMFGPTDVRFTRVHFDTKAGEAFEIYKGNRISINSCLFTSTYGAFFNQCKEVSVNNSVFRLTNLAPQAIYSVGSQTLSITGNTVSSESTADPTRNAQWGLRLYVNQQGGRFQYLAKNTTSGIGLPTSIDNNIGEQILWEGGGPQFIGSPTTTSNSLLTFSTTTSGIDFGNSRYYAVVVQGKGIGQVRRIVGQASVGSGMNLTVESPFAIFVDPTSIIQLLTLTTKSVVYGNSLTGLTENVTRDTYIGPAGIMLFGGTSNITIDRNTLTNIRLGIAIWSLASPRTPAPNQYESSGFNMVSNNTITGARYAMMIEVGDGTAISANPSGRERSTLPGNVFRGNTVRNALESAFDVAFIGDTMNSVPNQTIENLIIEHNSFVGVPVGINFTQATRVDYRGMASIGPILHNALVYKNSMQQQASSTATPINGSKGMIIGDAEAPLLIGNTITGFQTDYSDDIPIFVGATGTPNTFSFTITPRDIDRKGGVFSYWVDWDNNGSWDEITPGVQVVTAGRVFTFTHAFVSTGVVTPKFMIVPTGDIFAYVWTVHLDLSAATNIKPAARIVSATLLSGPTSNYLEYLFSVTTNTLLAKSAIYTYAFDWNNDGFYEDARYGGESMAITKQFSAAGLRTVGYTVADMFGNRAKGQLTFDPGSRFVYFEGSDREDAISFVEINPGSVRADLSRVGGRDLSSVKSATFGNILGGVYAHGNGGPDYLNAGNLTTIATTIFGGSGSDTIVGGARNDTLWGAGPTGTMKSADVRNVISGGAGSDTIWTGTNSDLVVASNTSIIQSSYILDYPLAGAADAKLSGSDLSISDPVSNKNTSFTASLPSLLNFGIPAEPNATTDGATNPSTTKSNATKSTSPTSSKAADNVGTPVIISSTRSSIGTSGVSLSATDVDDAIPSLQIDENIMDALLDLFATA